MFKKTLLFSMALMLPALLSAQTTTDVDKYMQLLRSDIRAQKVQVITNAMLFSPEEAAAFWPVYNRYQEEMKKIGDQRVAQIKDYAANYDTMTDAKATELTSSALELEEQRIALLKKYVPEFSKAITPKRAARFVQVEMQVNRLIDLQIGSEIPLAK